MRLSDDLRDILLQCGLLFVALLTSGAAVAQDAQKGALAFKRCALCHSVVIGSGPTIGPNLAGIVGRKAGTSPNFVYSKAMAEAGFSWDQTQLDAFIAKPQSLVKGTRMTFPGLSDATERADLVAYLETLK